MSTISLFRIFIFIAVLAILAEACHPYRTKPRKRPCRGRKGKHCFYRNKSKESSESGEVIDNCTADCKGYTISATKCPSGKKCSSKSSDVIQDIVEGCQILSCPDGYKLGAYGDENDVLDFSTTVVQCQKKKWYGGLEGDIPFGKTVTVVCYKV